MGTGGQTPCFQFFSIPGMVTGPQARKAFAVRIPHRPTLFFVSLCEKCGYTPREPVAWRPPSVAIAILTLRFIAINSEFETGITTTVLRGHSVRAWPLFPIVRIAHLALG